MPSTSAAASTTASGSARIRTIPNTRGIRNDIIEALKAIKIPNLRWPGGCFADDYHWRDGIGPRDERPKRINMHWGQVIDTNAFGTHEFLDLCELIGAEPYIAGNVGSGTPEEMRDWIEYMTFDGDSELANLRRKNGRDKPWKIKYFGVGNENWGCGGNMRPEYYADLYPPLRHVLPRLQRQPAHPRRLRSRRPRPRIGPASSWTAPHREMQALLAPLLHRLARLARTRRPPPASARTNGSPCSASASTIERAIDETEEIMDRVDPRKRIELYVDEWGSWYRVEPGHPGYGLYQQNSLRDAVLAGLTFHIFHEHNDRVKMANIAQMVNVLQAMILTDGEKMLLTPTYHVFEMYKVHHDATRLPIELAVARLRVRRQEDAGAQRSRPRATRTASSTSRWSTPTPRAA